MGITLSDLSDCAAGWRNPIVVGELPDLLRVSLKLRVPKVHLSRESLLHIRKRHPDVTEFEFCLVSLVIEFGTIMQEKAKPQILLAVHEEEEYGKPFVAVMKIANKSSEVWLTSFHRAHARQIANWRKRHVVLREGI